MECYQRYRTFPFAWLMNYVIEFRRTPILPVAESHQVFPVGRIYCVGRNYAEHAREMGHDPERDGRWARRSTTRLPASR